ncbi:acetate--CoA ligase family protein [Kibdelosporangium persicum]|uniref:Succinyl-CoA synthetase subunit alpha n=1 Tax=Kibdelosporangium persicum TaxID=2698649 RepID=A0ABX2F9B0_9PSEU|nr:acetate--CoA ligase family protein [Kibdelosporangium persicum]NRN67946.1 Succinyl-CoA synthetase subunit alpha [Kibdelosporangium persicum]
MHFGPLFHPRGIAVAGASDSPGKAGNALVRTLSSFDGDLYPVNPAGGTIAGRQAYPTVAEIGAPVDLAVLAVPPRAVPGVLADCGKAGVAAAIVCSGGFAEAGPDGAALQDTVTAVAREHGIRLLGPNTSGFVNPVDGVFASFVPGVADLPAGPAAIVAQSGGVNLALCFLAAAEGLGVRLGVGLGNAVDIGFADVLDYLADDDKTTVIGLHVEGVSDGRRLVDAVARAAARKPVVALKVGRTGVGDFARSHTGAITGPYALTRAALAQAGAVVVDDPTGLVDALRALAARRVPPTARPGVGVLTGQAGPGLIIADALHAAGVSVPALTPASRARLRELLPPLTYQDNPVDTGRPAGTFPEVAATVAADPGVDALAVYALDEPGALDLAATVRAVADTVPVLVASGGPAATLDERQSELSELSVPLFRSPDRLARAMSALADDAAAAHRRAHRAAPARPAGRLLGPEPVDEHRAKELLTGFGVAAPARRACDTRAAAHQALTALGGPVVVKIRAASVIHKSDVDAVRTGVRTADALDAALDAIDRAAAGLGVEARYLVERQAAPGPELIVGGTRDPVFGPAVLLGVGGVGVELAPDPVLRLAPLSDVDIQDMVAALPSPLLAGYRGAPPVDRAAVGAAIGSVAALLLHYDDIAEVEVNPLRLTRDGPVALDAVIMFDRSAGEEEVGS